MGLAAGIGGLATAIGGGLASAAPALTGLGAIAGAGANIYGAVNQSNANGASAKAQQNAYQQAAANLSPWMTAGQSALAQQQQLLGLGSGGAGGQSSAIAALQQSPLYQALYHNGQQSILANAAATGGLRGGNTQTGLYNLGVNTLANTYQQDFQNLGSLSGLGENAGAMVGNNQVGAGTAQAAGILGTSAANNQIANSIAGLTGNQNLLNALGLGGGIQTSTSNILGPQLSIAAQGPTLGALSTSIPSSFAF